MNSSFCGFIYFFIAGQNVTYGKIFDKISKKLRKTKLLIQFNDKRRLFYRILYKSDQSNLKNLSARRRNQEQVSRKKKQQRKNLMMMMLSVL